MSNDTVGVCFIGGDDRQKYAAEELSKYISVKAIGDCFNDSSKVESCDNLVKAIKGVIFLILPLPAAACEKTIDFLHIANIAKINNMTILGGKFSQYMKDIMTSLEIKYFDYFEDEALTVKNAYLTAEGALCLAMNALKTDIKNSKFAILGYGRIGKALGEILSNLKGDVTVLARRDESLALAETNGCCAHFIIHEDLSGYDVVFNTIPSRIINNEQLLRMSSKNILIELASSPGGFDVEIAEQSGIYVIKAPGVPGKYAPISAGKIISDSLKKIIKREGFI